MRIFPPVSSSITKRLHRQKGRVEEREGYRTVSGRTDTGKGEYRGQWKKKRVRASTGFVPAHALLLHGGETLTTKEAKEQEGQRTGTRPDVHHGNVFCMGLEEGHCTIGRVHAEQAILEQRLCGTTHNKREYHTQQERVPHTTRKSSTNNKRENHTQQERMSRHCVPRITIYEEQQNWRNAFALLLAPTSLCMPPGATHGIQIPRRRGQGTRSVH